jgi:hypothetical protein
MNLCIIFIDTPTDRVFYWDISSDRSPSSTTTKLNEINWIQKGAILTENIHNLSIHSSTKTRFESEDGNHVILNGTDKHKAIQLFKINKCYQSYMWQDYQYKS